MYSSKQAKKIEKQSAVVSVAQPKPMEREEALAFAHVTLVEACQMLSAYAGSKIPKDVTLLRALMISTDREDPLRMIPWENFIFVVVTKEVPHSLHVKGREVIWINDDHPEGLRVHIDGNPINADFAFLCKIGTFRTEEYLFDLLARKCYVFPRREYIRFLKTRADYTNFKAEFSFEPSVGLHIENAADTNRGFVDTFSNFNTAHILEMLGRADDVSESGSIADLRWSRPISFCKPDGSVYTDSEDSTAARPATPINEISADQIPFVFYEQYEKELTKNVDSDPSTTYIVLGAETVKFFHCKVLHRALQNEIRTLLFFAAQSNEYPAMATFLEAKSRLTNCSMTIVEKTKKDNRSAIMAFLFHTGSTPALTAFHHSMHSSTLDLARSLPVGSNKKFTFIFTTESAIAAYKESLMDWMSSPEMRKMTTVVVLGTE